MERIEFFVQGSAAAPYRIIVEKLGVSFSAFCTCPAGEKGQYCKHRFNVLSGNPEGLVSGNESMLMHVVDRLAGTDVENALVQLARAEDQFELSKRYVVEAKKKLAVALRS